jgi:hypothetical protein
MRSAGDEGDVERQLMLDGLTPSNVGAFPEALPKGHPARLAAVVVDRVRPYLSSMLERVRALGGGSNWALESAVATLSRDLSDRERRIREAREKLIEMRHVLDSQERGLWFGTEAAAVTIWRLMDDMKELLSPMSGGVQ